MSSSFERFAPKVHPATRPVEQDDPMALCATAIPGDPAIMLECLVMEYARLGWGSEQILALFRDPFYPTLYQLWRTWGEADVRTRLADVLQRTGVFRVREVLHDEPAPPDPELVQLGMPMARSSRPERSEGSRHAEGQ